MTVELSELSLHLGDFIEKVVGGEHIMIQDQGRNLAELRPPARKPLRPYGIDKGKFEVNDEFFAPLPDEVLRSVYEQGLSPDEGPGAK